MADLPFYEPSPIPGLEPNAGWIPGGVNVPTGPGANVDPFIQLLQEYLNDPSGFLAQSVGLQDRSPTSQVAPGEAPSQMGPEFWSGGGNEPFTEPNPLNQEAPGQFPNLFDPAGLKTNYPMPLSNVPGVTVQTPGGPSDLPNRGNLYYTPPERGIVSRTGSTLAHTPGMIGNLARDAGSGVNDFFSGLKDFFNQPGYSSPEYLRSIGYTPGQGTESLWPSQGTFVGGAFRSSPGGVGAGGPLGRGSGGRIMPNMLRGDQYWMRHLMSPELFAATQAWMQPVPGISATSVFGGTPAARGYSDYVGSFESTQDVINRVAEQRAANPVNYSLYSDRGGPVGYPGKPGGGMNPV